jgi:hypothetical protein
MDTSNILQIDSLDNEARDEWSEWLYEVSRECKIWVEDPGELCSLRPLNLYFKESHKLLCEYLGIRWNELFTIKK